MSNFQLCVDGIQIIYIGCCTYKPPKWQRLVPSVVSVFISSSHISPELASKKTHCPLVDCLQEYVLRQDQERHVRTHALPSCVVHSSWCSFKLDYRLKAAFRSKSKAQAKGQKQVPNSSAILTQVQIKLTSTSNSRLILESCLRLWLYVAVAFSKIQSQSQIPNKFCTLSSYNLRGSDMQKFWSVLPRAGARHALMLLIRVCSVNSVSEHSQKGEDDKYKV